MAIAITVTDHFIWHWGVLVLADNQDIRQNTNLTRAIAPLEMYQFLTNLILWGKIPY